MSIGNPQIKKSLISAVAVAGLSGLIQPAPAYATPSTAPADPQPNTQSDPTTSAGGNTVPTSRGEVRQRVGQATASPAAGAENKVPKAAASMSPSFWPPGVNINFNKSETKTVANGPWYAAGIAGLFPGAGQLIATSWGVVGGRIQQIQSNGQCLTVNVGVIGRKAGQIQGISGRKC